MQFILTFTIPPATRDDAVARFLDTGGRPPPGVRLLGRWTRLDLCGGVALLEGDDPQALAAFAHGWSDVLELTLVPVLEDQALTEVLTRAGTRPIQTERRAERGGLPQAAAIVADQELPQGPPPEADQTGEAVAAPPPAGVPGGPEGEGEEPAPPRAAPGRPSGA